MVAIKLTTGWRRRRGREEGGRGRDRGEQGKVDGLFTLAVAGERKRGKGTIAADIGVSAGGAMRMEVCGEEERRRIVDPCRRPLLKMTRRIRSRSRWRSRHVGRDFIQTCSHHTSHTHLFITHTSTPTFSSVRLMWLICSMLSRCREKLVVEPPDLLLVLVLVENPSCLPPTFNNVLSPSSTLRRHLHHSL